MPRRKVMNSGYAALNADRSDGVSLVTTFRLRTGERRGCNHSTD